MARTAQTARVIYHVYDPREEGMDPDELRETVDRHQVPCGHLHVETVDANRYAQRFLELMPRPNDFQPELAFETYAQIRRARWLYRVEVAETEPENLGYLRSGMLVAGELAVLCDGLIFDASAQQVFGPERVVQQLDRNFYPFDHVSLHIEMSPNQYWVHTHGMGKFAHPDLQILGVPEASLPVAEQLLYHLSAAVVAGGSFASRHSTKLCGFSFDFEEADARGEHFDQGVLTLSRFELLEQDDSLPMTGMLSCTHTA